MIEVLIGATVFFGLWVLWAIRGFLFWSALWLLALATPTFLGLTLFYVIFR
jgi:hypothetical protein